MRLIYLLCLAISPLFLSAGTIIVKTKAPQNKNVVFQYRVPKGYDKNRREMYRGGCKKNLNNSLKLKIGKFFKFDACLISKKCSPKFSIKQKILVGC